jgi:FKBP-type peptidyl-prolyl cis-trans isomerase
MKKSWPIGLLSISLSILFSSLASCQSGSPKQYQEEVEFDQPAGEAQQDRIAAHRDLLAKERLSIELYIQDRDLAMERSGTGLYYQYLERDTTQTRSANTGDEVSFYYQISLLNGELLYASEEGQPARLLIDQEEAEIGLHEALKLLSLGDKGRFILPSHLAFGVAGDQQKVPPFSALLYELEVVDIQDVN